MDIMRMVDGDRFVILTMDDQDIGQKFKSRSDVERQLFGKQ